MRTPIPTTHLAAAVAALTTTKQIQTILALLMAMWIWAMVLPRQAAPNAGKQASPKAVGDAPTQQSHQI
jgi:hypothetical protein